MFDLLIWAAVVACLVVGDLRWLRVAQREHYEPGRVIAIAWLWSRLLPWNAVLFAASAVLVIAGLWLPWLALPGLVGLAAWPLGLNITGRTSKLAWTGRLKRLAGVLVALQIAALVVAWRPERAGLVGVLLVGIVEIAVTITSKIEEILSRKFVVQAQEKLRRINPTVVAITGSYGKTSTKLYVAHLLSTSFATVASPASFNNRLGLSRAVNDRLAVGTEVFVAEMGTYGPGEIRALCELFSPEIAAITTIGEAHLERMHDRATIVRAKSEIVADAKVAVLNIDVPELAQLADQIEPQKRVIRCATEPGAPADVVVSAVGERWLVNLDGEPVTELDAPTSGHPINLAIAIGVVRALGVEPGQFLPLLGGGLPTAAHRAEVQRDARGVWIIDDTYNSNPVGAARALATASATAGQDGHIMVITPGMVELGSQQDARNAELAAKAVSDPRVILGIVGRTNRTALLRGARGGPGEVRVYPNRQAATAELASQASAGDVILYENDLPDHYA